MSPLRVVCLSKIIVNYVKPVGRFGGLVSTSATIPVYGNMPVEMAKRTLSTGNALRMPAVSIKQNTFSEEDHDEFMAYFPEFVDVLTSEETCVKVPKLKERLNDVLKYNVNNVNNARGVATVFSYKAFETIGNLSQENIKLAVILGWCVRMVEASFLTLDDISDNSFTRGGKPCWFRNKNVGLKAISDGVYMGNGVYYILKTYLSTHPQYLNLVELISDTMFKTSLGQSMDQLHWSFDEFTFENFNIVVFYKAEYCSMYTSVAAAMFLANISDERLHKQVKSLLASVGVYCQIQNDFADCFGNPEDTGKIGTDIREGKLSWLAMKAFQKASTSQRKLLRNNYGRDCDESFQVVRNLYDELNLREEYRQCEEQLYNNFRSEISQLPTDLPHELFNSLLNKIYDGKWGF